MRRDSLFYQLFQRSPVLLFELLENPPEQAEQYRFDSVAVKEPKFEIDGVFLPPESDRAEVVYFCEVQFQKDERLYERLFGESLLYFYRNRERFADWQAVVIYPSRSLEQSQTYPYRSLLESPQVHRVYLDELGAIEQLPLNLGLLVLTTLKEQQAPVAARSLIARVAQEAPSEPERQGIIDLVVTIMAYRFSQMSRVEVEAMLGLTLQETRVYQEARAEGEEIGEQRGRQEAGRSLVLRQLMRRLGLVPDEVRSRIATLSIEQLENLAEALLDFSTLDDLLDWLAKS
jgi:predicted transposase/invertase (TIGR01784 family)